MAEFFEIIQKLAPQLTKNDNKRETENVKYSTILLPPKMTYEKTSPKNKLQVQPLHNILRLPSRLAMSESEEEIESRVFSSYKILKHEKTNITSDQDSVSSSSPLSGMYSDSDSATLDPPGSPPDIVTVKPTRPWGVENMFFLTKSLVPTQSKMQILIQNLIIRHENPLI